MMPILFQFGTLRFSTIGLFFVLSFLVGGFIVWYQGRQEHFIEDELFDSYILASVWAAVASRIGFIALHADRFGLDFMRWGDLVNFPGLSVVVGMLFFPLALIRHAQQKRWSVMGLLDIGAQVLAAGTAVFWLGSFFDGSGIGNPTELLIGVQFPGLLGLRHPAQLYLAVAYALVAGVLVWLAGRYRLLEWYRNQRNSVPPGLVFSVWLCLHSAIQLLALFVMPAQFDIGEMALDWVIYPALGFIGLFILFVQSGRLLNTRKR